MVSPNSSPPLAVPIQVNKKVFDFSNSRTNFFFLFKVPQGHMVQQILDPNGTLQHVILTPEPMLSQHQPPPPPQSHPGVPITPYVSTDFSLFFANSDFFFLVM